MHKNILRQASYGSKTMVSPPQKTPRDSYQERQRQVLCKGVLEFFQTDISVQPLYRKSQLGTHNGNQQTDEGQT